MSVTLTDEQYGTVWRAMTKVACGRWDNNQRMSRDAVVTIAREACDAIGWRYDGKTASAAKPLSSDQGTK